jgi:hypothetical protein
VGLLFCCGACDFSDILFAFAPRQHNFVSAAGTANFKIHAGPQNQKGTAAAGMRLFHQQNIAGANIHFYRSFQGVRI